jgi:hypothetical protein
MKRSTRRLILVGLSALLLSACGGGGGGSSAPAPTLHSVTLNWQANRESGVNSAGGGYLVSISGQSSPIDVPYNAASGTTPTTTTVSLYTGSYTATVQAYAALDSTGGASGSTSASSSSITITVP